LGPEVSPYATEDIKFEDKYPEKKLTLLTRSRGTFYFRKVYLTELTINDLLLKIDERYINAQVKGEIFSIYTLPQDLKMRNKKIEISTDEHVANLHDNIELEIIWISGPTKPRDQKSLTR